MLEFRIPAKALKRRLFRIVLPICESPFQARGGIKSILPVGQPPDIIVLVGGGHAEPLITLCLPRASPFPRRPVGFLWRFQAHLQGCVVLLASGRVSNQGDDR